VLLNQPQYVVGISFGGNLGFLGSVAEGSNLLEGDALSFWSRSIAKLDINLLALRYYETNGWLSVSF
jgi:hypothetical protein